MFWFFGHKTYGILSPQLGIESASPVLEGEALTTGPPGSSFPGRFLSVLNCRSFELSQDRLAIMEGMRVPWLDEHAKISHKNKPLGIDRY